MRIINIENLWKFDCSCKENWYILCIIENQYNKKYIFIHEIGGLLGLWLLTLKKLLKLVQVKLHWGRSPHMDFGQYNLMTVPSNSRWITRSQFDYLSLDVRLWKWHGGWILVKMSASWSWEETKQSCKVSWRWCRTKWRFNCENHHYGKFNKHSCYHSTQQW